MITPFIRVTPLHALHHRWSAGQRHSGIVGGNYVLWIVTEGTIEVRVARGGHWLLNAGEAFFFIFSGERSVYAPSGAEWFSVSFRATLYDSLDLLALLPLPAVWTPEPGDFDTLRAASAAIARSWGSPEYAAVDTHTFPDYLRGQQQSPLEADANRALLCHGCAAALFARCWAQNSAQRLENVVGNRFPAWMPLVLGRLRETPNANVEELARTVGISRRQLGRAFQSLFGVPPREFLAQRRLNEARRLLQTSALPLTDIATQTGFASSAHLSRAFKIAFTTTPEAYRRIVHQDSTII